MKTQHEVYFTRGPCGHRELKTGEPPTSNRGRLQRVTKLMALAIRFDQLIRDGIVEDQGEIARLGHVTPARLSQIMGMLSLAPEIQEAILFLPRVDKGHDRVTEREVRRIARVMDWVVQRVTWREYLSPER
ncbi:hypothetical protein SV7mr_49990 [Stieleria bergensis]|uniref:Uncharacterized protein n=1 Tax=Stieleria bergensis TaxID=2528025 RepID=A0A517T290_9BACT|nr:hypothetical protein SV7mr_49990 [Planctomycetes bacterium SV_7m_r]